MVHSPVDGPLGVFQFMSVMDTAAMNKCACALRSSFFLGKYFGVELMGPTVSVCLTV